MVKVALAQIFYKPAIVEKAVDYLAEPGLVQKGVSTFSLLEKLTDENSMELQTLHSQVREQYVTYISQKLKGICEEAYRINKPDILVFPEYSVPYQSLPTIKEISLHLGMTIVAGTHTVLLSAKEYYSQAGLDPKIVDQFDACSIAPIFSQVVIRIFKSKMIVPFLRLQCGNQRRTINALEPKHVLENPTVFRS